jgi:hypothetical protein
MEGSHVVEVGEFVLVAALEIGGFPAEQSEAAGRDETEDPVLAGDDVDVRRYQQEGLVVDVGARPRYRLIGDPQWWFQAAISRDEEAPDVRRALSFAGSGRTFAGSGRTGHI